MMTKCGGHIITVWIVIILIVTIDTMVTFICCCHVISERRHIGRERERNEEMIFIKKGAIVVNVENGTKQL